MADEASAPVKENEASLVPKPAPVGGEATTRWAAVRRRTMELFIVIFGVYCAFLLNRLESDRRDAKRRHQILDALERETRASVEEVEGAITQNEPLLTEFQRRLAAGEMPGLGVSMSNSGYSATDDATLLQAGGLELLDVQTIELLRMVNSLQRSYMEGRRNQFEFSLAQLINHERMDFYDPATHQLKKRYEWWPDVQRQAINDSKAILAAEKALLGHLQTEQGGVSPVPAPATPKPL